MLCLLIVAIAIANIPGLTVTYLFLFYGTLRASTLLPTVMTLLGKKLTGKGVFTGVLTALCVGLPIFAYGNLAGIPAVKAAGSLTTVLSSACRRYRLEKGGEGMSLGRKQSIDNSAWLEAVATIERSRFPRQSWTNLLPRPWRTSRP